MNLFAKVKRRRLTTRNRAGDRQKLQFEIQKPRSLSKYQKEQIQIYDVPDEILMLRFLHTGNSLLSRRSFKAY